MLVWCLVPLHRRRYHHHHDFVVRNTAIRNADAKNKALQAAGAYVPRSFADMGPLLKALYTKLVKEGTIVPEPEG